MKSTLAVLTLMAGLAAACSPAAANDVKKATFRVTVEGIQKTSWSTNHVGTGGCDGDAAGSGRETVRFTSRPTKVAAMVLPSLSQPVLSKPGAYTDPVAKLRGKVARQGVFNAGPGECGGGGGGAIQRDCGTKSFRGLKLPITYRLAAKPKDQLDVRPGAFDDPFKNCPTGGYSFPTLLNTDGGEWMDTRLPRDELFDRSLGKIIVIARGKEQETSGEDRFVTTIRWIVTFTRLGRAAASASTSARVATLEQGYSTGTTRSGHWMSYRVKGNRVSEFDGMVWSRCTSPTGGSQAGSEQFEPPGKFGIGKTRAVAARQKPTMATDDRVTKHYRVTLERTARGFRARLRVRYSFDTLEYGPNGPFLKPWTCRGYDTLTV